METIDIDNLKVGKIYPAFDDGKVSPGRLCFVKIKSVVDTGYTVDIEWDNEIVATDQPMIYDKRGFLMVDGMYNSVIYPNTYELMSSLYDYLKPDDMRPHLLNG